MMDKWIAPAAFLLLFLIAAFFFFPPTSAGSVMFYLPVIFFTSSLAIASGGKNIGRGMEYLMIVGKKPPYVAYWAIVASAACLIAAIALSFALSLIGISDTEKIGETMLSLPPQALLAAIVLVPIGEEVFFRGLLFRKINEALPVGIARAMGGHAWIVGGALSSAVFSALHASYGSVSELAAAFTIGFLLCAFTKRTGSVLPAMAAHASINFASIISVVFL